jgi:2-polyprenyl-3-methyl-5-hydroxy-6-metoxy-1,4-benzoquinol methylase
MNFFRRDELTPRVTETLARYDETVRRFVGPGYPHPIRLGDWALARTLEASRSVPIGSSILDTGSYNTYLALALAAAGYRLTASDLVWRHRMRDMGRTLGLARRKPLEAPFATWLGVYRQSGVPVRNLNITRIARRNASYDCVIALSVLEHVPDVGRSLSELYRVLAPGGRMLVSTRCSPEPFSNGARHFSEPELEALFAGYPVTSQRNRPDFAPENWCHGPDRPAVTAFIEVTKSR